MVVVVFDNDFQLTTTLSIPRRMVEDMFPIRPYINGRIIITVTDAPAERDAPVWIYWCNGSLWAATGRTVCAL